MKKTKKLLFVVLMLAMVLSVFTACADTVAQNSEEVPQQPPAAEYVQGNKMEDFTVITHDGKEVSLYDILEQKDMVLLNFWPPGAVPAAWNSLPWRKHTGSTRTD